MRFFTVKKSTLVIVFLCVLLSLFVTTVCLTARETSSPKAHYTVVIDAGHGGIDGGCVGKETGVFESDLNLTYAKILQECLNNMGISTLLTRTDSNGLYEDGVSNRKKSDMKKRKEIIEDASPVLVVSIHMNSYTLSSSRGAQAFYKKGNEEGEKLCSDIQDELHSQLDFANPQEKVGDYYIVNCTDIPSVLVECGFLSNIEEEALLVSRDYQEKVCYAITCGIVKYLNETNNVTI